ncbi:PLAC8 family-domain-containing protein [Russula aff. rugulosa BPL654]|nr:PLAC8 family-domain-containing protein [Russula aff. rugulosa BPL654]
MSSTDKNAIVKDQPKASVPMSPRNTQDNGGGDRNALRIPVMEDGLRGWSYDIFDCFADKRTCALSCCCCCYVYSRNKRRLEHLETHGTPRREPVERCNRDCQWFCLFGQAALALQAITRYDIRRRYGIRGDAINDVCISGFCHPCGLVQEHREILLEESSFESD